MKKWWVWFIAVVMIFIAGFFIPGLRSVFFAPMDMLDAVSTGMEIKQIETMVICFHKKLSRWPTGDEFQELIEKNFPGDKADSEGNDELTDLWGEPYNYFRQGSGFVLTSMGPDRRPGTQDDITLLRRK